MITITCKYCGHVFEDYIGEHATPDLEKENGLKDYDRFYDCPKCGETLDLYDPEVKVIC